MFFWVLVSFTFGGFSFFWGEATTRVITMLQPVSGSVTGEDCNHAHDHVSQCAYSQSRYRRRRLVCEPSSI